jgi:hypothetical protein
MWRNAAPICVPSLSELGNVEYSKLDLQLPNQSMPITTDVVSSNLDQGEMYNNMW